MEFLLIGFGFVIVILLILLLIKNYTVKNIDISPYIIELKSQIDELKTKQLQAQTESLREQQKLLIATQNSLVSQLNALMKTVSDNLSNTQSNIITQLKTSNNVINEIQNKLGSLEAATKNIQEIGKDISSLQEILQSPKLRGNLGEYFLEELLKDIFPANNYELQYTYKDGTKVDAILKLGSGIVPIDSKFPLDSFQRLIKAENEEERKKYKTEFIKSVKNKIDDIASKYIKPDEGTFDFAMLYIPAENVFYEVIISDSLTNEEYELFTYAVQKHIIPVSPNSFYAYLMALVYGLKGFRIEQQAKLIIGKLTDVQNSFSRFYENFTVIGKHLNNAVSKYRETAESAEKFNNKLAQITNIDYELNEGKPIDLIDKE